MQWFRLRPTFEIPLAESRAEALAKIESQYQRVGTGRLMFLHGEYGEFHLPASEHRLWSPHLSFYVYERDVTGLIHGRFAPRLEVWTFVWVIYLAMSFSAFFGLALAYSQWTLGATPWGSWISITAMIAIIVLYIVAHVGQQWSSDQMTALRERLDDYLRQAGVVLAD